MDSLKPDSFKTPPLFTLPAELIHHILSFLSPLDLVDVSQTCRLLHTHTLSDHLWQPFVQANVPGTNLSNIDPVPSSWRTVYTTLHPYWFLTRHKLWFGDSPHTGKLLITRYNARSQAIEAFALVAERRQPTISHWHWNPDAIIHSFSPRIQLDLNVPVLRIDAAAMARRSPSLGGGGGEARQSRLEMEVPMELREGGISVPTTTTTSTSTTTNS
ncbi:hypothetical protein AOQ84DRAFT_355439, partial [Glonium stellatum]